MLMQKSFDIKSSDLRRHTRLVTVIAFIALVLLRTPSCALAAPQLIFDPPSTNINVWEDEQTQVSVSVINKGSLPVTVDEVLPDCSCTEAHLSTNVISPGGIAQLIFTYTPNLCRVRCQNR